MKPANTSTLKLGDIVEILIDSLSYHGGRGVGRSQGLVVFVPDTAPGDLVKVRLTAQKPRFFEGEIVEILKPSPARRSPECPVYGRCGGCVWQHIQYSEQVQQKEKILVASLKKLDRAGRIEWRPFVPAANEFNYRNRIQLHGDSSGVGFFARHSRDLVTIESCPIAEPAINQALAEIRGEPGLSGRIELAVLPDGQVVRREPEFGQVNTAQNLKLREAVVSAAGFNPDWIFDLYCGSGNLTEPLARQFPKTPITAIELSRSAILKAKELHPHLNIDWRAGDVALEIKKMNREKVSGSGLVVVDPPRAGLAREVIEAILKLAPKQIVYVSCNPTTFARDAEHFLTARPEWKAEVQGFDMFPQTEHVELVASLCAAT